MKRAYLISGATIVALAIGTVGASAKGWGMKGGFGGPQINFEEVDADKDGQITKAELEAHAKAQFDTADTDGNGMLSAKEIQVEADKRMKERMKQRSAQGSQRMLEHKDANNDGQLSFEEMQATQSRMDRMFGRMDDNNDGMISAEELAEMQEKRHSRGKHNCQN